ncbi:hypothetical protein [Okeania sp. SIO2C2]|nr:hypothetical protein [Okeania sp. SIO2C2]
MPVNPNMVMMRVWFCSIDCFRVVSSVWRSHREYKSGASDKS